MDDRTIYMIDRIVLGPRSARAFIDAYLSGYTPRARAHGGHPAEKVVVGYAQFRLELGNEDLAGAGTDIGDDVVGVGAGRAVGRTPVR